MEWNFENNTIITGIREYANFSNHNFVYIKCSDKKEEIKEFTFKNQNFPTQVFEYSHEVLLHVGYSTVNFFRGVEKVEDFYLARCLHRSKPRKPVYDRRKFFKSKNALLKIEIGHYDWWLCCHGSAVVVSYHDCSSRGNYSQFPVKYNVK